MLPRFTLHLAFSKHSPLREQRELCFKLEETAGTTDTAFNAARSTGAIQAVQSGVRNQVFKQALNELDLESPNAIQSFVLQHAETLRSLHRTDLPRDIPRLREILADLRRQTSDVLSESVHDRGAMFSFEDDADFRRRYEEHMQKLGRAVTGEYPNAFQVGATIYFNREHADFQISEDALTNEKNAAKRTRAIRHELAHACIDEPTFGATFIASARTAFIASRSWESIQAELQTVFGADNANVRNNDDFVHEAIAIYLAESKLPPDEQPHRAIVALVEKTLSSQSAFRAEVERLGEAIAKQSPIFEQAFTNSVEELHEANAFNTVVKDGKTNPDLAALHTNAPEKQKEMKEAATHDIQNGIDEVKTPEDLLKKIQELDKRMEHAIKHRDAVINLFKGDLKVENAKAYDGYIAAMKKDRGYLCEARRFAESLRDWPKLNIEKKAQFAETFHFKNAATYKTLALGGANVSAIITADAAAEKDRKEALEHIAVEISGKNAQLATLEKFIEEVGKEQEDIKAAAGNDAHGHGGLWTLLKHEVFSSGKNVMWISVLDVQKIWEIYKSAVVENYHDSQGPRTYDFAKNWNLWSPIQDKLKQQARAHNEEEVSKYKSYLEKEKFTYDQLFGEPGTNKLFEQNLHHVNRAKAVLEYASDHAWLYNVDRHNGHNVYGFDYEGNFGDRAFEELMEHNADKQKSESDNGYTKANHHPEISMIIDDMTHEFHKKNLWSVKGMMKRLQEKAKLAESNTWAVTTLLRAMRKDPDVLKLMDIGMLDAIGSIGITQTAWSMTLFKTERHDIRKWQGGKLSFDNPKNFLLAEVILEIEKRAPAKLKSTEKELDHYVARVLAGQTMSDDAGKPVSIFEKHPIFDRYREHFMEITDTTPTEVANTDPDFFNPGNGGSDMMLLGGNETANILAHKSQGPWIQENKAINYLTQIFMRDSELGIIDPAIQAQFRADMRVKLKQYLNSNVLAQANACNALARSRTLKEPQIAVRKDLDEATQKRIRDEIKDKSVIDELKARKMFATPEAYDAIKKKAKLEAFQSNGSAEGQPAATEDASD